MIFLRLYWCRSKRKKSKRKALGNGEKKISIKFTIFFLLMGEKAVRIFFITFFLCFCLQLNFFSHLSRKRDQMKRFDTRLFLLAYQKKYIKSNLLSLALFLIHRYFLLLYVFWTPFNVLFFFTFCFVPKPSEERSKISFTLTEPLSS